MAQAGVSLHVGPRRRAEFGESLAGVRDRTPKHQFQVQLRPHGANGQADAGDLAGEEGADGSADKKVQAYNFRVCMTKLPENRVPFPKPAGYDAGRYELLARMLAEMDKVKQAAAAERQSGAAPAAPTPSGDPMYPPETALVARRRDEAGPHSERQDRHEQQRRVLDRLHRRQLRLSGGRLRDARRRSGRRTPTTSRASSTSSQNDPQVPKALHDEMAPWGLCKDEFTDTGNWPHQLYVREARRMVGEYVMSQKDIQTELTKPDVIGMGSYNSDSHNVQRIVNGDGAVENEGDMQVPVTPYQIPYRDDPAEEGGGDEPARAGRLLRDARRLLDAAHGAAVHDHRPGGRRRGEDGDRRESGGAGHRPRRAAAHAAPAARRLRVEEARADGIEVAPHY